MLSAMLFRRLYPIHANPLSAVLLLVVIVGIWHPVLAEAGGSPVILLYTGRWEQLFRGDLSRYGEEHPAATDRTVGRPVKGGEVGSGAIASSAEPLLLRTVDGKAAAATMTVEQLVAYWGAAAQRGVAGIGIDEFTGTNRPLNTKLLTALALTRWRYPHLYIAVWQAGRLDRQQAYAFGRYADLVVLEAYSSNSKELAELSSGSLAVARQAGILHKTVIGLGINDLDPTVGRARRPWANSRAEIESEMRWVHHVVPISPGVALFAANASPSLESSAYNLASKIFSPEFRD